MTTYEKITIALSILSFLTILVGLIYGALQLKNAAAQLQGAAEQLGLTKEIHRENHEWSRRLAAQEALREYSYSVVSGPLQEEFDYLNITEPLSLASIEQKFGEHRSLQKDLHQLLNFYEGLARGINQGLFDEEIVKSARKNSIVMADKSFQNYIAKRRTEMNSTAWRQLSSIASKWESEDHFVPARAQTGGV